MTSLLVTNDFPPKVGGIQTYLWELWRRLPVEQTAVLTRGQPFASDFDAASNLRVQRIEARVLLPTPRLRNEINRAARKLDADLVVFDPALPLGAVGPNLGIPYAVIVHGAELVVGARLPVVRRLMHRVLVRARLIIAASEYTAREVRRLLGDRVPELVVIPPGVDAARFRPLEKSEVAAARRRFGFPEDATLVVSHSRLVPRKGMDVLIEAATALSSERPDLVVAIAGSGRDAERLARLRDRLHAPVQLLGSVSDADLPVLVGCADLSVMLCRTRWLGLEQEGFGIVFLEAAAAGVPQVAGRSGGATEAVVDGVTGRIADRPADVKVATEAIRELLSDAELRHQMGVAGRDRAVKEFDYDDLAAGLAGALDRVGT